VDVFLISAVTCLLLIRTILEATGWPQLGNDTLHIAHMLWGGLGMVVAIIVLLALPSRVPVYFAAIAGGLGFGAFIDELGKFITADNNYFFEPTIGLIYIIFMVLYLTARLLRRVLRASAATYMTNALEWVGESFVGGIYRKDRERALEYLGHCDQSDPAVTRAQELVGSLPLLDDKPKNWIQRGMAKIGDLYRRFIGLRWVTWLITAIAVGFVLANGAWVISLTVGWTDPFAVVEDLSFGQWGQIAGAIISGVLGLVGVGLFWKWRAWGYRLFDYAVLVSIFITQIFRFFQHELQALAGLVVSILLHLTLAYAISREEEAAVEAEMSEADGETD